MYKYAYQGMIMFNFEKLRAEVTYWTGAGPEIPAIILTLFIIIAYKICKRYLVKKRKRDRLKAIENAHIIRAKLIKQYCKNSRRPTWGKYEYTVEGKLKHKIIRSTAFMVKLYYVNSPYKLFSDYDVRLGCGGELLLGILVFILSMILILHLYFL